MVDELTSWGWKIPKKEETENDKQMDYEAVFKLVDIKNSSSITNNWYKKCNFEVICSSLSLITIARQVPGSQ